MAALSPLRHRSFAVMWTAGFVSNIGTWMETIALAYYVTEKTHQAAWAAVIAAAGFVPLAFLGPFGGAIADRGSRRRIFFTTTLVLTALASLIAVLTAVGNPHPGIVALVVLGEGCASALGFPAYQAIIPDMVPPEDLVGAIGLGSASFNLGRVVGPALAGVVLKAGGISWALWINAASFLAILFALTVIRLPHRARASTKDSIIRSIKVGAQFVRSEPGLAITFKIMCVFTFLASPFIALLPAMAIKVLHGDKGTAAILVTAQGIGAVIAGFRLGFMVDRFGSRMVLVTGLQLLTVALMLYALAPNTALVAIALAPLGAIYLSCLGSFTSIAQQRAPAELRGRVVSLNMLILGTCYPLGSLLQGKLADLIGLRVVTASAAVALAAVLTITRVMRPGITEPLSSLPSSSKRSPSMGSSSVAPLES